MAEVWKPEHDAALAGVHVLVVEDDFLILMELDAVLHDAGAEVVDSCRTIEAALARLDKDAIGVAVLDLRVGRESIAPVARRLAERGVPFVFYTGQIESDPIIKAWPAARFVQKPASSRTIVDAVAAAMRG